MTEGAPVFGHRVGFGLRPAVLVVDMSRAFTDRASPLACDADSALAAGTRLVDVARAARRPIVFTTTAYTSATRVLAAAFLRKTPQLGSLEVGDELAQVDPRTGVGPEDEVLVKPFASAFAATPLAAALTADGVDTVVLAGASSSGCVRSTAVDAVSHGFRPIVVREAVADRDPDAHRQALLDLDGRYADVEPLDTVIRELNRVAAA